MGGKKPPKPISIVKKDAAKHKESKAYLEKRERAEPKIKAKKLECPARLNEAERAEWDRITTLYLEFEEPLINDLDVDSLMVYIENLVLYKTAMDKVKETSPVYKSPKDAEPKVNPWLKVANEASHKMRVHADTLLLDPISRAKMGCARVRAEEMSPMERFLKERAKDV